MINKYFSELFKSFGELKVNNNLHAFNESSTGASMLLVHKSHKLDHLTIDTAT